MINTHMFYSFTGEGVSILYFSILRNDIGFLPIKQRRPHPSYLNKHDLFFLTYSDSVLKIVGRK